MVPECQAGNYGIDYADSPVSITGRHTDTATGYWLSWITARTGEWLETNVTTAAANVARGKPWGWDTRESIAEYARGLKMAWPKGKPRPNAFKKKNLENNEQKPTTFTDKNSRFICECGNRMIETDYLNCLPGQAEYTCLKCDIKRIINFKE